MCHLLFGWAETTAIRAPQKKPITAQQMHRLFSDMMIADLHFPRKDNRMLK